MENVQGWIEKAQRGDEEAFGELMKTYHQRVYGLVYNMVNNVEDAKELSQLIWIRVWNKIAAFKGGSQFFTWLYRIASNLTLDFLRKRRRERMTMVEDTATSASQGEPDISPRPDQEAQQAELRELFYKALEELTPEHKLALTLREVDGLSYEEIGRIMNCRKGTVMSRIFYARKSLLEKVKERP